MWKKGENISSGVFLGSFVPNCLKTLYADFRRNLPFQATLAWKPSFYIFYI